MLRISVSLSTVRLSSSLRCMVLWKTPIERASAPISSARSPYGIVMPAVPVATASVTPVMCASGRATARQIMKPPNAASMRAASANALRIQVVR